MTNPFEPRQWCETCRRVTDDTDVVRAVAQHDALNSRRMTVCHDCIVRLRRAGIIRPSIEAFVPWIATIPIPPASNTSPHRFELTLTREQALTLRLAGYRIHSLGGSRS